MWGTDWTRAVRLLTYEQGVEALRVADRLSDSDRATLMVAPWPESTAGRLADNRRAGYCPSGRRTTRR